jgi:hypothetical protein
MQAQPFFPLVMPRFARGIDIEPGTGKLLRRGRVSRQRVLEPATARLIDFVAVLLAWGRTGSLPQQVPRAKDFAEWHGDSVSTYPSLILRASIQPLNVGAQHAKLQSDLVRAKHLCWIGETLRNRCAISDTIDAPQFVPLALA